MLVRSLRWAVVAVAALLLSPSLASACTPTSPPPTPKERLAEYNIAVYGVVSSLRWVPEEPEDRTVDAPPPQGRSFVATMVVTRVFKGLAGRRIQVAGNTYDPCGGFEPRVGWKGGLMLDRPGRPHYRLDGGFSVISITDLLRASVGKWRAPGYAMQKRKS